MVEQVGIDVPARVRKDLELLAHDDAKVQEYGLQLAVPGASPGVRSAGLQCMGPEAVQKIFTSVFI